MICVVATIGFQETSYNFLESSEAESITVVLTGELAISVSVLVSTIAGTATGQALMHVHVWILDKLLSYIPATAGADFVPILSRKLTFNSTVTSVSLTLNITTDKIVEDTESLSASLTLEDNSLRSVTELNPNSTDITITDSTSEHNVSFHTKFSYCIYLDLMNLYVTLRIDCLRFTM